MKKVFILFLMVIPFTLIAQRSNVAHINTNELWNAIPEKQKADSVIMALNKSYAAHYEKMGMELQELIQQYQTDTTSNSAIKKDLANEISTKQQRMEAFRTEAEKDLQAKKNALIEPIRKKMQEAVDKVAKKYKYDYVLDTSFGNIIYTKNDLDDILDLVKKELGI